MILVVLNKLDEDMQKNSISLAVIGWLNHRDDNLIKAITLLSRNIDDVSFPLISSGGVFRTSPLVFDFANKPVILQYNQEGPELERVISDKILPTADGVLVSLGGYVNDLQYLQEEKTGEILFLKRILNLVRQRKLPTIYALLGNKYKNQLDQIREILSIDKTESMMIYSYYQPGSLAKLIKHLIELCEENS